MITNYLSPLSFTIVVDRLPHIEFFTQKLMIPSLSSSPIENSAPIAKYWSPPDVLTYGDLDLTFIIDEDMKNYIEMLRWIEGITSPDNSEQYANLKNSEAGIKSDITVILNNNHKNPNVKFTFKDCFPTTLSALSFDITGSDIQYIEATSTFRYTNFTVDYHS